MLFVWFSRLALLFLSSKPISVKHRSSAAMRPSQMNNRVGYKAEPYSLLPISFLVTCIRVYIRIHIYTHKCSHMYMYIHAHIYIYIHAYIYIYIYDMYLHVHVHI